MTSSPYQTVARVPTVKEYLRLRSVAGLSAFSEEAATKGLAGTLFSVVVEHDGTAIGMGRLIGDGGCFVQVVDIAVDPQHQGRSLGKAIMTALTGYITANLPPSAYVSLIADVPANTLYEKFGFEETAPRSVGMARRAGAG